MDHIGCFDRLMQQCRVWFPDVAEALVGATALDDPVGFRSQPACATARSTCTASRPACW